jgi:phosphoglycerol transferase MdoB-like AlkP superfamily enzyme
MPESKEDDKDEKEEPSWIVEYGDKGHYSNGNEENNPASFPEETVSDVASI